jgi:hypothetical protein
VYAVVLQGDDQLVRLRQLPDRLRNRQHPAWVDDRHTDALVSQQLGDRQSRGRERTDCNLQHVVGQTGRREHVDNSRVA